MGWIETNPASEWFSATPAGGLGQASTLPSDGAAHPERPIGFIWPEATSGDEEEDGY